MPQNIPPPPAGFVPADANNSASIPPPPPGFVPASNSFPADYAASRSAGGEAKGMASAVEDAGIGAVKGVGKTIAGVGGLLTEVPGLNKVLPYDQQEVKELSAASEPHGTAQEVGSGAEGLAEFAGGDEVLTGLSKLAKIAKLSPELLELAEKYPKLTKLLTGASKVADSKVAQSAAKGAITGGTQGAVKGAAEGEAKEGAEGGALGGGVGGAVGGAAEAITNSNLAKAMMNRSAGVTKNMIRYGADPAEALVSEDLPVFSTLTNQGRVAATTAKLNELKPLLDKNLQASPVALNWQPIVGKTAQDAKTAILDNEAITDAEKQASINQIDTFVRNVQTKYPTGNMSPFEMNELKSRVQKFGAEFDSRPDATDGVRNFYAKVQSDLRDAVNQAVPGTDKLNQRVANLTALKNATHETILAEKAGIGPLSGFGTTRKIEAAAGHVAPAAAKAAPKITQPVVANVASQAGRYAFTASDGSVHSVDDTPENREAVSRIDPNHQPIQ